MLSSLLFLEGDGVGCGQIFLQQSGLLSRCVVRRDGFLHIFLSALGEIVPQKIQYRGSETPIRSCGPLHVTELQCPSSLTSGYSLFGATRAITPGCTVRNPIPGLRGPPWRTQWVFFQFQKNTKICAGIYMKYRAFRRFLWIP